MFEAGEAHDSLQDEQWKWTRGFGIVSNRPKTERSNGFTTVVDSEFNHVFRIGFYYTLIQAQI